jgi:hypothetical protein
MKKYNLLRKRISDFFIMADLSKNVKLVDIDAIKNRCLVIKGGEHDILTPCVDLNEHD